MDIDQALLLIASSFIPQRELAGLIKPVLSSPTNQQRKKTQFGHESIELPHV